MIKLIFGLIILFISTVVTLFLLSMFVQDFKIQNGKTFVLMALFIDFIAIWGGIFEVIGFIPSSKLGYFVFLFLVDYFLIYGSLLLCKKIFSDFQMESKKNTIIASVTLSFIITLLEIFN